MVKNHLKNSSRIRIRIFTIIESIRPCHTPNLPTKFHLNPSTTYWDIILYTDRQTDRQGWRHNLLPSSVAEVIKYGYSGGTDGLLARAEGVEYYTGRVNPTTNAAIIVNFHLMYPHAMAAHLTKIIILDLATFRLYKPQRHVSWHCLPALDRVESARVQHYWHSSNAY